MLLYKQNNRGVSCFIGMYFKSTEATKYSKQYLTEQLGEV